MKRLRVIYPKDQKEKKMNKKQLEAAAMSYVRAALASVAALYMSGIQDPKVLANAFIAGLIGPILKALQKSEKQYGLGAK